MKTSEIIKDIQDLLNILQRVPKKQFGLFDAQHIQKMREKYPPPKSAKASNRN